MMRATTECVWFNFLHFVVVVDVVVNVVVDVVVGHKSIAGSDELEMPRPMHKANDA